VTTAEDTTVAPGEVPDYIHPDIAHLAVRASTLHGYHKNARRHAEEALRESLRVNGQYRPVVTNRGTHTGRPIVGLSKLARVVEGYARRLQSQELLGSQVADALVERLDPLGAACIITSHHACMGIRGVRQPDAVMTTSSLRGRFIEDTATRAELMSLHQASCGSVS